ncbi:hypothetical protein KIN20_035041 [Parelaphostrongylus tenuis]|uniref:Uncharacterized protein n=1 Tax=Parelaphostrongylus tenuis TaxID=148309 RepID=A0AAD5WK66_PARTN|nr:hypothetical protein KIN20_035041 [Parelaphostrongylus tenuis]
MTDAEMANSSTTSSYVHSEDIAVSVIIVTLMMLLYDNMKPFTAICMDRCLLKQLSDETTSHQLGTQDLSFTSYIFKLIDSLPVGGML